MTADGRCSPCNNLPKIILRNHSPPLNNIGQAYTSPVKQSGMLSMNFFKIINFREFSNASLPRSQTSKLAKATALLL